MRKIRTRPVNGRAATEPLAAFQLSLLDRAHQQAAVAALGQAALTGVELPMLLEQAAVFVSQTLSIDFSQTTMWREKYSKPVDRVKNESVRVLY